MARQVRITHGTELPTQRRTTSALDPRNWVEAEPEVRYRNDKEKFDAEEVADAKRKQDALDAIAKPYVDKHQQLLRELRKEQNVIMQGQWNMAAPLEEIQNSDVSRVDPCLLVPRLQGKPRNMPQETQAMNQFLANLPALGYTITPTAKKRLTAYACVQVYFGDADVSTEDAWRAMWDRLIELNVIPEGEMTYRATAPRAPEPTPEPEVSIEDLGDSREDRAKAKEILEGKYFGQDAAAVWKRWIAFLQNTYGFCPTEVQERKCVNWFSISNKSFLNESAYDACRRAMVYQGIFPDTMLTPDELLARALENAPVDDYDSKREFMLASNRINR